MSKRTPILLPSIICLIFVLSACRPAASPDVIPPTATPTVATTAATQSLPLPPGPSPTAAPAPTATSTPFPFTWAGSWNVWIANPKISIVKTVEFVVEGDAVRAEWYEGTRHVLLEGRLSADGATISGTFWNSDVEALPIVLLLAPDASFFTGTADSEAGLGQFCGTRTAPQRPNPCRGIQD